MFFYVVYNDGVFYSCLYFFDDKHNVDLTEKQAKKMIALFLKQGGKKYEWNRANGLTEIVVNLY